MTDHPFNRHNAASGCLFAWPVPPNEIEKADNWLVILEPSQWHFVTKTTSHKRFGDRISSPKTFRDELLVLGLYFVGARPGILYRHAKGWFAFYVRLIVSLNIALQDFEARFGNRFQITLLKQVYIYERAIPDQLSRCMRRCVFGESEVPYMQRILFKGRRYMHLEIQISSIIYLIFTLPSALMLKSKN